MLSIKNITIQYGKNKPVIEDFDLNMKQGEIISIVGESGSGKTTLIRGIAGLLPGEGKVIKGNIMLQDESLLNFSKDQWNEYRGTKLSMIFQDCGSMLNPIRKIGAQFVEYILTHEKMSKKEAYDKASQMLCKMRLPNINNIMNSYPFQLSGGMRQRVGIAMAMTFKPKILIADEPTSALDVTTQAQIIRQMIELRDKYNTSIIIVTHNLGVATYMADKIVVMKDGKIVEQGNRFKILHSPKSDYTKKLLDSVPAMEGKRYV